MPSHILKPKLPSGISSFDKTQSKQSEVNMDKNVAVNNTNRDENAMVDPEVVHKKIRHLLDCYPSGIRLDAISDAFRRRFSEDLKPAHYGFSDIQNLILALPSIAKITEDQDGSGFIVSRVYEEISNSRNQKEEKAMQNEVDGKIEKGIQNINETQFEDQVDHSCYKTTSPLKDKLPHLPDETKANLKDLLKKHFPGGLTLNELIGAYRGFYGATLEDLDPAQYGYYSLEEMLKVTCDFVALKYCGGEVMLSFIDSSTKCDNTDNSILDNETWDVKAFISLPAVNAVDPGSQYKTLNAHQLYQPETMTEVVVGEVFSPSDFYIIHRGIDTSQALDALMDQMMEFYSSPIGERYKITNENLQIGAPVAALYKEDDNWYRAFVTGFVDLISVKLFFCDYGTKSIVFNKSLRKLHTHFFDLPAQAKPGRLHGLKPVNDARRLWPKKSSRRLLELLQDKALVANITKVETDIVYMSLWDTSDSDINVSDILISEGLAKCEDGSTSKEITDEKKGVHSNSSTEISLNIVSTHREMTCGTDEDNFLCEQRYPSNKPFENSTLSINCTNTEQHKLNPIESNIRYSDDNENAELITKENFELNILLEKCNNVLQRENINAEKMSREDSKEVQIYAMENESSEIIQPIPILASTPRQDDTASIEAFNKSSISQGAVTPKKAPPIPPGFDIKADPPSSASIPPGFTSLHSNYNTIPIIPQQLQIGNALAPSSFVNYEFPNGAQLIAPENKATYPLFYQNKHESSIEAQYTLHKNVEIYNKVQSANVPKRQFSTSASLGFEELPITYFKSKEDQNCQENPKSTLEDETFFSDEDLGGSSLSINAACRSVECFSLISGYKVHVLKLSGAPYILSGEISQVMWESDKLRNALAKKKKDLPFVILNQTTHPDVFQQLIKLKAASALDRFGEPLMSLFAYPLQVVPRILKIFKKDHEVVMKAFQDLLMIYKEDPDYIPFDESFVWPDDCSAPSYPNEEAVGNVESSLNLITDCSEKEINGSSDKVLNISSFDVNRLEDCTTFEYKVKESSNSIEATSNDTSEGNIILKNKRLIETRGQAEYICNDGFHENLTSFCDSISKVSEDADEVSAGVQINVGIENVGNDSNIRNVEDNALSSFDPHYIKDHSPNFVEMDKTKKLCQKVGTNISSNCTNRSLKDMSIDNSSDKSTNISSNCSNNSLIDIDINKLNKSVSDASTVLSDQTTINPETRSLDDIKKRMSVMYKKKQSNLQNLLMKDSKKTNQIVKKLKLPKELISVDRDLKPNEKCQLINLPKSSVSIKDSSSCAEEKGAVYNTVNNCNNKLQAKKDNKTKIRHNYDEVETIYTSTNSEIESINPNINTTIMWNPHSFNFADSIQHERMLQEINYFHVGKDLKNIPPSKTVMYNPYQPSNAMGYPNYMPQFLPSFGYAQQLQCIYYPVPTPMFPLVHMPQNHKHK